ncbi:MAG TPA: hypothetical protein DEG17_26345 [Cyanobacteria bacterium UBA11149]|nr:hypothetical protein [Cyanobacteria bacterium UBA11367]HBE60413.1 hypothetical protein [Cyanobacteria bacterium UBA11366]HBK64757.1 hypothetical protein [Cyanobacteria bacterium UBA11166]HBR73753.1 hypothetical protein [Cyanobacteria bacterium UBA11159]HBS69546.1 hypothetical protein [Cyanobacteria bacterium UBA11153]HBW92289.1 hypothetical protein [Cyanobacteria bacterium UBA11149]HCA93807.1 hypothetical protein [Cyanobacteria bacterium UBA9226]
MLLLKERDLDKAIEWINHRDRVSDLEVKFIIRSLVWEMWQLATNSDIQQATIEAVEVVQKFRPQLKQKTNSPDTLIREILKWTRPLREDTQILLLEPIVKENLSFI